ncbi:hypothetical protein GTR02_01935 [Kineococcus sp. R8]|uniref:hypothetical protein n=1 Tax=Kineococcus siccus TaxID=2696567 RepID=UPI001411BEEB|nr:hypothetical protein [Kineococcus siccus]NAZ80579.1 hypothetical protein [Kineococcus siccus]
MGARWRLYKEGKQLQWGKNFVPARLLSLFVEAEKYVDTKWLLAHDLENTSIDVIVCEEEQMEEAAAYIERTPPREIFGYRAPVAVVKQRLDLMGFTSGACKEEVVTLLREVYETDQFEIPSAQGEGEARIPYEAALETALSALLKVQDETGAPHRLTAIEDACLDALEPYLGSEADHRTLLALQLSTMDPAHILSVDLHDLMLSGYFAVEDAVAQVAFDELTQELSSTGPVIVVTEGSSDADLLQRMLRITAPAVADFFRFLDYTGKPAGGVDHVVKTLRSFSAAGVTNRVIGVLDNDVAGRIGDRTLRSAPLRPTIKWIMLPDVPYAQNYPTLGPAGEGRDDVNGCAVSIEFQFGEDCLRGADGQLTPIQWSKGDKSLNARQGELSDKRAVKRRITAMLQSITSGGGKSPTPWPPMHALTEALIDAAKAAGESGSSASF